MNREMTIVRLLPQTVDRIWWTKARNFVRKFVRKRLMGLNKKLTENVFIMLFWNIIKSL